jgi:hypothetical protein
MVSFSHSYLFSQCRKRKRNTKIPKKRKKRKLPISTQVTAEISLIVSMLGGAITFLKPIKSVSDDPNVLEALQSSIQKLSSKLFPNAHRQEVQDVNTRENIDNSILDCARSHNLIQNATSNVKIAASKLIDDYQSIKSTMREEQKENEFWISFGQFALNWIKIIHSHRSYLHTAIKQSFFGMLFSQTKISAKDIENFLLISSNTLQKYKQKTESTNHQLNEPVTPTKMTLRSDHQEVQFIKVKLLKNLN